MTVRSGNRGGRKSRGHIATAPVLAYYGSKNRLAKRITSLFVPHVTYCEPFFGSGAVLFTKPRSKTEVINDIDGELVNFFRVVRERPGELTDLLDFTPYARDEFQDARDTPRDGMDELERARRFFVATNASFSGVGGDSTDSGFSFSAASGQSRADLFRNRTRRLRPVAHRLKDVEVENVDALELLPRLDSPTTTFYLDPPYLGHTRVVGNRGYQHNAATEAFHDRLLTAAVLAKGQVVISGYASDLYDHALKGWHRFEVPVKAGAGGEHTDRTEVIWANRRH